MPGAMRRPQFNAQIAATHHHHRPPSLPALTRGCLDVQGRTEPSRGWHRDLWDPCTIPPHSRPTNFSMGSVLVVLAFWPGKLWRQEKNSLTTSISRGFKEWFEWRPWDATAPHPG